MKKQQENLNNVPLSPSSAADIMGIKLETLVDYLDKDWIPYYRMPGEDDIYLKYDDLREFQFSGHCKHDSKSSKIRKSLLLDVSELNLSRRIRNNLSYRDVNTIGDLLRLGESELLSWRNMGRKSVQEIEERLESKYLYWGMDIDAVEQETIHFKRRNDYGC